MNNVALIVFTINIAIAIFFQLALAAGVPWGEYSMGGKFPGKYPPQMRIVAIFNALLLTFFDFIVFIRAEVIFSEWFIFSRSFIWFIFGFFILSILMNAISPVKKERLWAIAAFFMAISSGYLAFQ